MDGIVLNQRGHCSHFIRQRTRVQHASHPLRIAVVRFATNKNTQSRATAAPCALSHFPFPAIPFPRELPLHTTAYSLSATEYRCLRIGVHLLVELLQRSIPSRIGTLCFHCVHSNGDKSKTRRNYSQFQYQPARSVCLVLSQSGVSSTNSKSISGATLSRNKHVNSSSAPKCRPSFRSCSPAQASGPECPAFHCPEP